MSRRDADHLWDRSGADPEVERLEAALAPFREAAVPLDPLPRRVRSERGWPLALAALLLLELGLGWWLRSWSEVAGGAGDAVALAEAGGEPGAGAGPEGEGRPLDPQGRRGETRGEASAPEGDGADWLGAGDVRWRGEDEAGEGPEGGERPAGGGNREAEEGGEPWELDTLVVAGRVELSVVAPQLACLRVSPDRRKLAWEVRSAEARQARIAVADLDLEAIDTSPHRLDVVERRGAWEVPPSGGVIFDPVWARRGPHELAWVAADEGGSSIQVEGWPEGIAGDGAWNKTPAWDPKGTRLVFSSGRTGSGDLYLWHGGEPLQLTFDSETAETLPTWSPDGRRVAYVREDERGDWIFLLDVQSFTIQPLAGFEGVTSTRPSYSPDGRQVAFFSNEGEASPQEFGLWVVDARPGGEARRVASTVRIPLRGGAAWTPDGRALVAVRAAPDEGDPLCLFPVDGGAERCLDTGTRGNRDPELVPDPARGRWLLFFVAASPEGGERGHVVVLKPGR